MSFHPPETFCLGRVGSSPCKRTWSLAGGIQETFHGKTGQARSPVPSPAPPCRTGDVHGEVTPSLRMQHLDIEILDEPRSQCLGRPKVPDRRQHSWGPQRLVFHLPNLSVRRKDAPWPHPTTAGNGLPPRTWRRVRKFPSRLILSRYRTSSRRISNQQFAGRVIPPGANTPGNPPPTGAQRLCPPCRTTGSGAPSVPLR